MIIGTYSKANMERKIENTLLGFGILSRISSCIIAQQYDKNCEIDFVLLPLYVCRSYHGLYKIFFISGPACLSDSQTCRPIETCIHCSSWFITTKLN